MYFLVPVSASEPQILLTRKRRAMASSLEGQLHSPTSQEKPITASTESKEHYFASNEENFLFPLRMLRMDERDDPVGSGLAMHTGRT